MLSVRKHMERKGFVPADADADADADAVQGLPGQVDTDFMTVPFDSQN